MKSTNNTKFLNSRNKKLNFFLKILNPKYTKKKKQFEQIITFTFLLF